MPSTSRGGFFRPTMQLHFCAFNMSSVSHIHNPSRCPLVYLSTARVHPLIRDGSLDERVLLNRKKGSPAIILPAHDVLSFVCHGHCDIRCRPWMGWCNEDSPPLPLAWRNVLKRRSMGEGAQGLERRRWRFFNDTCCDDLSCDYMIHSLSERKKVYDITSQVW